jgi:DNA invertase Pin-like site-specific DNA recombinase
MATTQSKTFGYVRVSTKKQTTDQQVDALVAAGVPVENIYGDVRSGAKWDRDGLEELRKALRAGDTLVVVALDRLGRSLSEMVKLLDWIVETRIELRSLREGIDLATPTGKMLAGIFAAMAEYERALIIERADAAREAARARGKQVGRPAKLTPSQIETARIRIEGKQSISEVAKDLNISRATLYRALAN